MKLIALVAAIGGLSISVAACGSSASTTTPGASNASSATSRYQARLALAKCLRSHGVNVPDPSPSGGVAGGGGGGGGELRALRSDPNFQSALQACAKYRAAASPFSNLTPAQRAQFQQEFVKFAECMRAHGVNIPDPTTSSGGGFGLRQAITPSVRNSPVFRSAFQACSSNLPFRRGGAGGPPPGGAAPGA